MLQGGLWAGILPSASRLCTRMDCSLGVRSSAVHDGEWRALTGRPCGWQDILIILKLAGSDQEKLASQIQILRILRVVRLGRLFKAAFLSAAGQGLLPRMPGFHGLSYTHSYFLQLLFSIAVMINFLGCLWYVPCLLL